MKRIVALSLALLVMLTGCAAGGIAQEEYDSLKADYEALKSEYDLVSSELDAANLRIAELDASAASPSPSPAQDLNVPIHSDDYVNISFIGCEEEDGYDQLVFLVENKTNGQLTFQADSMAIDGLSLGYCSGSDSVAAQSKGKIRFETKEEFPTMTPSAISGVINVIDFEETIWGSMSYDISFVNVDVKSSSSAPTPSADVDMEAATTMVRNMFGESFENIKVGSADGGISVIVSDAGLTDEVTSAMSSPSDSFLSSWGDLSESVTSLSNSIKDTLKTAHGYDGNLTISIVDDINKSPAIPFMTIENGEKTFDILSA